MNEELYIDNDNHLLTIQDFKEALKKIGAYDCDYLFIYTDIIFGRLAPGVSRKSILELLTDLFLDFENNAIKLLVPTYTYSFCNNEVYDVKNSKSYVGVLNESIRKLPNRFRTYDPLLSISIPNELQNKFEVLSDHSLGVGSALDIIHKFDRVKFLFFGVSIATCFSYLHYIEKILNVPYRFDMPFSGNIILPDGKVEHKTQIIHTQCEGILPREYFDFEDELVKKDILKKVKLGDSYVSCVLEKDIYNQIVDKITKDINYFLQKPFTEKDLNHKYMKGLEQTRITHC